MFKEKMRTIPNELAFGCTLLPGALVAPSRPKQFNYGDSAERVTQHMETRHANPGYIPNVLNTSVHVFVRVDGV